MTPSVPAPCGGNVGRGAVQRKVAGPVAPIVPAPCGGNVGRGAVQRKAAGPVAPVAPVAPSVPAPCGGNVGRGAVQRKVAGPVAPSVPAAAIARGQGTVQRYFKVGAADFGTRNVALGGTAVFTGQDKDGGTGSFLDGGGAVRRSDKDVGGLTLRISDDGRMAMEDTDINTRQAKSFYAEKDVVKASNKRLGAVGSAFRLVVNENNWITVPDRAGHQHRHWALFGQGRRYKLYEVMPRNTTNGTRGVNMQASQNCNAMGGEVTGAGTEMFQKPILKGGILDVQDSFLAEERVATFLGEYANNGGDAPGAALAAGFPLPTNAIQVGVLRAAIALQYGPVATQNVIDDISRQLGVNSYATPKVGETYATFSIGAKTPTGVFDHHSGADIADPWGYHWGGVVARSGADTVTLENYARLKEDDPHNLHAATETRHFFQMYGPANSVDGDQSWHAAWRHDGFANGVTIAFSNGKL